MAGVAAGHWLRRLSPQLEVLRGSQRAGLTMKARASLGLHSICHTAATAMDSLGIPQQIRRQRLGEEVKNPYSGKKKAVGINLSPQVLDYFKALAEETGVPYQKLIDLYLLDCTKTRKKLKMK